VRKLFILLLLIIFPKLATAVIINEIMYNPSGADSEHEWVEIYNNNSFAINTSGWKFYEAETNHGLTLINGSYLIQQNQYAIIADNSDIFLEDYPDFNSTLFDSSFSLSNTGETIAIKNSSLDIINEITYNNSIGGDNNGNSISLINNSWQESTPTPGQKNSKVEEQKSIQDIALEVYLDDEIYIIFEYTNLFKIININPEFGKVYNITVNYNITKDSQLIKQDSFIKDELNQYSTTSTGSFTATEAGNYTLCGVIISSTANDTNPLNDEACKTITVIDTSSLLCNISINITTEKILYDNKEQIKFYNNLNDESFPYTIEYWIEDLFGTIIKKRINTTNTNQKSFTPDIDEKDRVFFIKNKVYALCNDLNTSDNSAEKLIIIKGSETIYDTESSINIEQIYDLGSDNKAKFGQTIRVRLNIYKGNTTKESIKLWIENDGRISKESKTNVYEKYTSYDLTLPVQIKPNCDGEFDDDDYKVIVEGLDARDTKKLEVGGITDSLCEEKIVYKETEETIDVTETSQVIQLKESGFEQELLSEGPMTGDIILESKKEPIVIYESSTIKMKNLILYFIVILLTILCVILIWKR